MLKTGIYEIVNTVNKKRYIGSTERDLMERKQQHWNDLVKRKHCNIKLQRDCNKYGINVFVFNVLNRVPSNYCRKLEDWYLTTQAHDYNIAPVASGGSTYTLSKTQCELLIADYISGDTTKNIAKRYGISEYTVGNVIRGKSYLKYNLDKESIVACNALADSRLRGDHQRAASYRDIGVIRDLLNRGIRLKDISSFMGVLKTSIHLYRKKGFYGVDPIFDADLYDTINKNLDVEVVEKVGVSGGVEMFLTILDASKAEGKNPWILSAYISGKRNDPIGNKWTRKIIKRYEYFN